MIREGIRFTQFQLPSLLKKILIEVIMLEGEAKILCCLSGEMPYQEPPVSREPINFQTPQL